MHLLTNPHNVFLVIHFLEGFFKKETNGNFLLHKYVNVFQIPITDIAAVLNVACKYLFALSLNCKILLKVSLITQSVSLMHMYITPLYKYF